MSDVIITINCPNDDCEHEFEIPCEYEGADPSVGIMNGGPIPSDDVPVKCDYCETTFTPEQIAGLCKKVKQECEDWRQPDDEPEYAGDEDYDRYRQ